MAKPLIDLLKATSRSFFLIPPCGTLLPGAVRLQIGLAPRLVHRRKYPASLQDALPRLLFPETVSLANIRCPFGTIRCKFQNR